MEIVIEKHLDIFQDEKWPRYSQSQVKTSDGDISNISLISYTANEPNLPRNMDDMYNLCAKILEPKIFQNPLLSGYKVSLFVAYSSWQLPNRISMYKGLWKSLNTEVRKSFPQQIETMFERDKKLRFAGFAEVNIQNFPIAINILRNHVSALVITHQNVSVDQDFTKYMFSSAFPKIKGLEQTYIDWASLVSSMCPNGHVILNISGSYDERFASIDCFMLTEYLPLFDDGNSSV